MKTQVNQILIDFQRKLGIAQIAVKKFGTTPHSVMHAALG
jgi:hypothetical protein